MTDQLSENQKLVKKPPAIWIPITLAMCAYILGVLFTQDWNVALAIHMITEVPSLAISALGAIPLLLIGFIHLAISQFFKSKRNSHARRYIMINWSIASIALLIFLGIQK